MITNIAAIIIVSVLTNWTEIYEQVPAWDNSYPCQGIYASYMTRPFDVKNSVYIDPSWPSQTEQGKYLGKDGVVMKVTEVKFDHEGEPQVHRIEKPLANITRRGHDKPPVEPERVWDKDIRTPIEPAVNSADWESIMANTNNIIQIKTNTTATLALPTMYIWSDGTVCVDKEPTDKEAQDGMDN